MKKIASILLTLFLAASLVNAQKNAFAKGDKVVNIGIGLGNALYTGSYFTSSVPPLSVSFEQGIVDNVLEKGVIGVGGYLGYAAAKWESFGYGWKYSNIIIGARGSFHYPLVNKLDTYAGLLLGYNVATVKEIGTAIGVHPSSGGIILSGYLGGRYYFTDKLAGMLELGWGIAYLNLGVAIKF
jgi:hypothetical protein